MPSIINASTSSGLVQSADTSGTIELQSNGTTKLTVNGIGVGIGTNSPTNRLSVVGGRTNLTANNETFSLGVQYGSGAGLYYVGATNSATPDLVFSQVGGLERMRVTNEGTVAIGTFSPNASAILDVQSTTKGVCMPNMTTAQKNAISSPAAGLIVFDTTLAKLCVYTGSAWETITSV